MEEECEMNELFYLAQVFAQIDDSVNEVRAEVYRLMIEDAWRVAMRSRHYLTSQCLDKPSESAWMSLYMNGTDKNFLNATSLTRASFHQLLQRFSTFYHIHPVSSAGGRPPKLRYLYTPSALEHQHSS
ncbi:hypothetical protein DVH05_012392 [Phytophthora capsici]|nr:hypothetical protein DVH05_012392 [Phytophthora capsici]|eukprot:jgi/Phyca11/123373/e_gw1.50.419.1